MPHGNKWLPFGANGDEAAALVPSLHQKQQSGGGSDNSPGGAAAVMLIKTDQFLCENKGEYLLLHVWRHYNMFIGIFQEHFKQ